MMRLLVASFCVALVLPVAAEDPKDPTKTAFQKLSFEKAIEKAKTEKKIVMVDFYADWCGPCKAMDAKTFAVDNVGKFLRDKTIAVKINIDDNKALAAKHKITAIPCLVFLDGEGKEVGRILGFREAPKFLEEAEKIVK